MTDAKALRRSIIDALDREPDIDAACIGVGVENGVVTLIGRVGSPAEQRIAERAALQVPGVRALVQAIEVRTLKTPPACDQDIARRALVAIGWHGISPAEGITIQVRKGWVTLTGTTEGPDQRRTAEAAIRKLDGVAGISNLIGIRDVACQGQTERAVADATPGAEGRSSRRSRLAWLSTWWRAWA